MEQPRPGGADNDQERVLCEQVKMLYRALPLAGVATTINAGLLVLVQKPVIDNLLLAYWLLYICSVTAIRGMFAYSYRRYLQHNDNCRCRFWYHCFVLGSLLGASAWGAAAIFLFPPEALANQVFLAFVVGGTAAGAVTTLSFLPLPIIAFLSITLVPLMVQFIGSGSSMAIPMSIMLLLFLVITLTSAIRMYQDTRTNIRMRLESGQRETALRESEERYRLMFESAPLGVVHFDNHGKILACNDAFLDMTGATSAEMVGLNMLKSGSAPLREAIQASLADMQGMYQGGSDVFAPYRNTPVRGFFRGITVQQGKVTGGVAIIEDISEDKRIEKMKDEFVSTVSHELRTPLTSIIGALSVLRSGLFSDQPEEVNSLLDNAGRNSERLLRLINDMLDIDKIEAGKMTFDMRPIRVCHFLEHAIQSNLGYGRRHKVAFVQRGCPEKLWMEGDVDRLMQVMSNIMSNAAKFSVENSEVEIWAEHQDEYCRIAIRDSGPGIPKEFQSRLFDRFSQLDSSDNRRSGGTGLGLSIAEAIVKGHGGKIAFETQKDIGTTFYIDIPVYPENS